MANRKDYTGNKYGHLTALKYVRFPSNSVGALWLYRCDCGNEKELSAKQVTAGRIRTCGNCQYKRNLTSLVSKSLVKLRRGENELYQRYIRNASRKGRKWSLTIEQFSELINSNCILCQDIPRTKLKGNPLLYNSVNLVCIRNGYTVDNVVPMCSECSRQYGEVRDLEEFIKHIGDIWNGLKQHID